MNSAGSNFLDEFGETRIDTDNEKSLEKKLSPKDILEKAWETLDNTSRLILNRASGFGEREWKKGFWNFFAKELSQRDQIDVKMLKEYTAQTVEEKRKTLREKGERSEEYKIIAAQLNLLERMLGVTTEKEKNNNLFTENRWNEEMREKLEGPIKDIMSGVWKKIKKVFGGLFQFIFGKPKAKPAKTPLQTETSSIEVPAPIQANAPPALAETNTTVAANSKAPNSTWNSTSWGSTTPFSISASTSANDVSSVSQTPLQKQSIE